MCEDEQAIATEKIVLDYNKDTFVHAFRRETWYVHCEQEHAKLCVYLNMAHVNWRVEREWEKKAPFAFNIAC